MRFGSFKSSLIAMLAAGCVAPKPQTSPSKVSGVAGDTYFGTFVADPFRWMENDLDSRVRPFVEQHNRAAVSVLHGSHNYAPLKKRFEKILSVDTESPPVQRGDRIFFTRRKAGRELAVLYWRPADRAKSGEKILLDPNQWKPGLGLAQWVPDWKGERVAYAVIPDGLEDETYVEVVDVKTGRVDKRDHLKGMKYSLPDWMDQPNWDAGGDGFYYTYSPPQEKANVAQAKSEVRYHALHTPQSSDTVIYPATGDASLQLNVSPSRDGRWLFLEKSHYPEDKIYFRRAGRAIPNAVFKPAFTEEATRSSVFSVGEKFFNLTDWHAPHMQLLQGQMTATGIVWKPVIPEDANHLLMEVEPIGPYLLVKKLVDSNSELEIDDLDGRRITRVHLPANASVTSIDSDALGVAGAGSKRFTAVVTIESYVLQPRFEKIEIPSGRVSVIGRERFPVDNGKYVTEQLFPHSKDGTKVSAFVVRRKNFRKDGKTPLLLYGYGAWSEVESPAFLPSIFPWLDAGGAYAFAVIRGGGEYGSSWHDGGRRLNKQNSFDDLDAIAEDLIAEGYTSADRLALRGGSFGGLLVAGSFVQHPERYRAVLCEVPLIDMLRYHLSGIGQNWLAEFGTSDSEKEFRALLSYSPYHNLNMKAVYPALLIISGSQDERMKPFHARKFIARLDSMNVESKGPVLLRTRAEGHSGSDELSEMVEEKAEDFSFLMDAVGLKSR